MAIIETWEAAQELKAADLNDTFNSKVDSVFGVLTTSPLEGVGGRGTASGGTVNVDAVNGGIHWTNSPATSNWTINFRGDNSTSLNAAMANNQAITISYLATQGGTAYYPDNFKIDGSSVSVSWMYGNAPAAGNANKVDSYNFTIIKTGSNTFSVFGSSTFFG
jgi:phage-related protein